MDRVVNVPGRSPAPAVGSNRGNAPEFVRRCVRPGCSVEAAASMRYGYARRTVWIDNLDDSSDPHCFDLCARHADRLSVPVGWVREDRRRPFEPPYQAPIAV